MVTKLQRLVEIVEDRHAHHEGIGNIQYRKREQTYRGSVLNATPAELDVIRRVAVPMDGHDNGIRHLHKHGVIPGWKKWLDAKN